MITRYMETRDPAIYKKYKSVRNAVTREIRKIVRNEQHEVALQCKSNPKKFWNYINSKRTTKSAIGDLVTTDNYGNTVTVSGNEQKAEVLGSYFSGVFTKENNISYDTRNIIKADETLSQLNCQFGKEIILDKISQLNVWMNGLITWTKEFKLMLYILTLRRHSIKFHIKALSVNLRHII